MITGRHDAAIDHARRRLGESMEDGEAWILLALCHAARMALVSASARLSGSPRDP